MSHVYAFWFGLFVGAFVAFLGLVIEPRPWVRTLIGALIGAAASVAVLLVFGP